MRQFCAATVVAMICCSVADGQLRVVTYNTANSGNGQAPATPRAGMDIVLEAIGDEMTGGIARPIDVLALQEQESSSTSGAAFAALLNGIYGPGTYAHATFNGATFGAGRPGLVYNTQTVQLVSQIGIGNVSGSGALRQPVRYQLRPVGYDADADFFMYVSHYAAGSSSADQSQRLVEATTIRANADSLGDAHIIYAGDFNIQSSVETMYLRLLSAGNGEAFDPINRPGNWNNSSSFRDVHTQSPYDPSFNDPVLIGGGMDDRFDFQLITAELQDNEGMSYIPGSYHAFGNNGSHSLNDSINDPSNNAASSTVLNALARVSDHLPVVADYQVPAIMQVTLPSLPPRIIQGANLAVDVQIGNSANVSVPQGADELEYSLVGSQGLIGNAAGTDAALGAMPTHTFQLDTATTGLKSGVVTASTTSPQVPESMIIENDSFTVVAPSNASFHPFNDQDQLDIDFGILIPDGSQQSEVFTIFNQLGATASSNMDLDTIMPSGDTSVLGTDLQPFTDLFAGQFLAFEATIDTNDSGVFSATWDLTFSDEDIPGELTQMMTLSATGTVALPGDANLDGSVDGIDFTIWNDNKFQTGTDWSSGDFNFDGVTDGNDFTIWNDFKFQSVSIAAVPEPASLALFMLGLLVVRPARFRC